MRKSVHLHYFVPSFPLSLPIFVSYLASTQFHSFPHVSFCSITKTLILVLVLDIKTNGFNSLSVLSPFAIVSPFQVHLQEGIMGLIFPEF